MENPPRIVLLDVLRGYALVSIMLLHCVKHFDIYYFPDALPAWVKAFDTKVHGVVFFLFRGRSYSIFALLFGVSYAIQLSKQKELGNSFDVRFAWRMILLFLFGILNSAFYHGDVLQIYAVIGLCLIPLSKLPEKVILGIAVVLLLLPYKWGDLIYAFQHPDASVYDPLSGDKFSKMSAYISESSFWNTVVENLTNNKILVLLWNWEKGRLFSILALFLFGYVLAKRNLFQWNEISERFWKYSLLIASIAFVALSIAHIGMNILIKNEGIRLPVLIIESNWTNLAFMIVIVSGITLLFYKTKMQKGLMYFSSFGKMCMSNYIIQSIIGTAIFYGWGLGLYKYTGATYSLLIGLAMTICMGIFCKWWEKRYKQGPFEALWHKVTWLW